MGTIARYELLIWVHAARYDLLVGSVLLNIGCNRDWKRFKLNNQPAAAVAYIILIVVYQGLSSTLILCEEYSQDQTQQSAICGDGGVH